jgi:hypothetical protein
MNLRYRVELSQAERHELKALLSAGKHAVRKRKARTKWAVPIPEKPISADPNSKSHNLCAGLIVGHQSPTQQSGHSPRIDFPWPSER